MQYEPTKQKLFKKYKAIEVALSESLVDCGGVVLYRLRRPRAILLYGERARGRCCVSISVERCIEDDQSLVRVAGSPSANRLRCG
jgi:hypothetical protein